MSQPLRFFNSLFINARLLLILLEFVQPKQGSGPMNHFEP